MTMTSKDLALHLRAIADKLESAEEFELPDYRASANISLYYWGDKLRFLKAAKALGTGTKQVRGDEYQMHYLEGQLRIIANRDSVCKIVRPAVPAEYDCEPLLSQMEEASLGK
jgi:hypothetical protein